MATNNKKIKIVSKEEMLGESEKWFAGMISYIEKETINDEERLALFATFNRGIKAGINLFYETKDRIEYKKDPLSIYILGVKESIYIIENMIVNMLQLIIKHKIKEEDRKISFIQIYMKGIDLAAELYQRNKLDEDIIKVIEDLDKILSGYEGKDPEEIWEKIRDRIGVAIGF